MALIRQAIEAISRLAGWRKNIPAADKAWAGAIERVYLAQEFGHLRIFAEGRNAGIDHGMFRFGQCYHCLESFEANGGGRVEAGERLWFLGYYVFPYDGVLRLHFNDGKEERLVTFVDIYPETDMLIRSTFYERPQRYFEETKGEPAKTAALAALRGRVLAQHHPA